jgi:DNA-binding transcriptional regulator YdaS (Cro superfamily)
MKPDTRDNQLSDYLQHSEENAYKYLQKAIQFAGGQTKLAKSLNISQGQVSMWLNRDKKVPVNYVLPIEAATHGQISRYQLRGDIYGEKPTVISLVKQIFQIIFNNIKQIAYYLFGRKVLKIMLVTIVAFVGISGGWMLMEKYHLLSQTPSKHQQGTILDYNGNSSENEVCLDCGKFGVCAFN